MTDSWLQRLLTWTPGQTDMIKTVALVLMVIDHTGLYWRNNEVRDCWAAVAPLFGLVWGMNLARHAVIRQSQLNQLWCWALIAQGSFILVGYPWYMGNILFTFAVTGQAMRWFSPEAATICCWRSR
jgi:type-F conjugative transfer system pilin acetylase TraX